MFKHFCKLGYLILVDLHKNRDWNVSRPLLVLPMYTDVHHWPNVYRGDLVDFQYEAYRMRRRRAHLALAAWHTIYVTITIFSSIY